MAKQRAAFKGKDPIAGLAVSPGSAEALIRWEKAAIDCFLSAKSIRIGSCVSKL